MMILGDRKTRQEHASKQSEAGIPLPTPQNALFMNPDHCQDIALNDRHHLTQLQSQRLQNMIEIVVPANPFWADKFHAAGVDWRSIRTVDDLLQLPMTSKNELVDEQRDYPPYGRNLTYASTEYSRLHQTSGTSTGEPLRWLDTPSSWSWMLQCWKTFFRWIKLEPSDRICFPFSFGPFLGFWAGFEGALQQGHMCLAAGGMSSEARLQLILENQVTLLGCTPTYALRLADVAASQGIDLRSSSVRAVLVAGEPGGSIPAIRSRIETAWGARVFDHWGMTEIGPLANECADDPGFLTVLETECIAEIIDPNSGTPVPVGSPGELVITNLGRLGSPVMRYRTGDLVVASPQPHPSGRTFLRLEAGILGRIDDMLIIRGNNVFPSSIEVIVREFRHIAEFRIVVSRRREMNHVRLDIEPDSSLDGPSCALLAESLSNAIKQRLQFHAHVAILPAGSLARFEMKANRLLRE